MILSEQVEIAYKKLKASVFFDKTQLPLRDRIVEYEDIKIKSKLAEISNALGSLSDLEWEIYEDAFLGDVSAFLLPKELKKNENNTVMFNSDSMAIEMEKPQYFIDLPVEGHILSVLWVMSIGYALDSNTGEQGQNVMYEHSYGNRLKKNLRNEEDEITYSPNLFEPYFSQYERWRDFGLSQAKDRLNDKQDALILTLDFKSFFYTVDFQEKDFESYLEYLPEPVEPWQRRVNYFVYQVICKYSEVLREMNRSKNLKISDKNFLPIGFLPSNILSNWALTPFDNAIIERWNPVYYGRYVDDIIIVDKVEKNSPLYRKVREKNGTSRLTSTDVIHTFLVGEVGKTKEDEQIKDDATGILCYVDEGASKCGRSEVIYQINRAIMDSEKSEVCVQNSKVKVFYFQSGATRALLDCFKSKIGQNASEFRLMPAMDDVLLYKNYSEIFSLKSEDSIHKLRSVTGIELDKFSVSKFLGKYRKISGLIKSKEENIFEQDLMLIFDERVLIENYGSWERLFEILIINERYDLYKKLAKKIISALRRYVVPEGIVKAGTRTHDALLRFLHSAICRTSAIVRNGEVDVALNKICNEVHKLEGNMEYDMGAVKDFDGSMLSFRNGYCRTRMVNKYVLPLMIDCVLSSLEDDEEIKLFHLDDMRKNIDDEWTTEKYFYYPYIVSPQELSFALTCTDLYNLEDTINPKKQLEELNRLFIALNYPNISKQEYGAYEVKEACIKEFQNSNFVTKITSCQKDKLCVAIGNAAIKESDFRKALDMRPNRSYERYRAFSQMIDAAVMESVDLLVLPENFLPFEWLPVVARMCANNHIALVTGIEHIISQSPNPNEKDYVYNLTATVLPYEHDGYKFAHISYHNKVEYSPEEKRQIEGFKYKCKEGTSYQLFCWHDVWFPVYCCYELASIRDRALFRSYADLVVAVEWNKDIPYFSSIIESLCRDLHCYCIQTNSSEPGDSRVLSPTSSQQRNMIQTKGGKNNCILTTDIDIKALRDFQIMGYNLQHEKKTYKPTPPKFDDEILRSKRNGTLFDDIKEPLDRNALNDSCLKDPRHVTT